jgi:5,5'-dehydrodivanillate O-demethylase
MDREENERLTRVGPGTPAGEMLRRYWWPVWFTKRLTDKPVPIRILGEDLVLFRDGRGRLGLVEELCRHRSASLYYGFVEDDGLRCAYHGWKFDCEGRCIDTPFEPEGSPLKDKVRQVSYPVEVLAGVVFAYMGPRPAPLLPRWDVLLREDGSRRLFILPEIECNWLQIMENSCDPAHTFYLHAHTLTLKGQGRRGSYYYRPIEKLNFETVKEPAWCGIRKSRVYGGEDAEVEAGHPVLFPCTLLSPQRQHLVMHMRLPVDDTRTKIFRMQFTSNEEGTPEPQPEIVPVEHVPSLKDETGEYHMESFASHDAMAWETQGPITDRARENLGVTDQGVARYRRLLGEQIDRVEAGREPLGVIRDPAINERIVIEVSTGQRRVARRLAGSRTER